MFSRKTRNEKENTYFSVSVAFMQSCSSALCNLVVIVDRRRKKSCYLLFLFRYQWDSIEWCCIREARIELLLLIVCWAAAHTNCEKVHMLRESPHCSHHDFLRHIGSNVIQGNANSLTVIRIIGISGCPRFVTYSSPRALRARREIAHIVGMAPKVSRQTGIDPIGLHMQF